MDTALSLLERLNRLENDEGVRYSDVVRYHEFRPWWFHQQFVFDHYLVPFVRTLPTVHQTPSFRHLRRFGSQLFFRGISALALVRAVVQRPDVLVYTVDAVNERGSNRWLSHLYDALIKHNQRFLEIAWSVSGASAVRQAGRRKRPIVYWQGIRPLRNRPHIKTLDTTTDAERFVADIAVKVMVPRCAYSARMIRRFERLLSALKPEGVYAMDDSLHAFELIAACKRIGIPTVGIQHGQFSRLTVGMMGYGYDGVHIGFDRYCVWGEWFKQILVNNSKLISADSIVVAGSPRSLATHADETEAGTGMRVLFLGEHYDESMHQREVQPYLEALERAGIDVIVKPHPSRGDQHEPSGRLEGVLRQADVVVGSYSSAIFEAIAYEKPVVLFATSLWSDPHGLAAAGLATLAATPDEIVRAVTDASRLSASECSYRRVTVWSDLVEDAGEIAIREMAELQLRITT